MAYEGASIAVDPVIFTITESTLKVLLHQREKDPFKGRYELFGGLLEPGETAEQTLFRKLEEVLGKPAFFMQFHTFTEPKRDPRGRTISIGYVALIHKETSAQDRKTTGEWFTVSKLPPLAFDHGKIITEAHHYLREHLQSTIVQHFLPVSFPLNILQKTHETILNQTFDNRNFRKKMIASGVVEPTGTMETGVSHRPAQLYRFA